MTLAFTAPRYKDIRMEIAEDVLHRELAITVAEMEYPPFRWADEKTPGRLERAATLVLAKRVSPLADPPGHWQVRGKTETYTVAERCTCKASDHSSSKHCYHYIAVEVFRRLQARLNLPVPSWVGSLPLKGEPGPVPMARTPLLLTEDPTGLDVEEKDEGRRMNDEVQPTEAKDAGSMLTEDRDIPAASPLPPSSFTLHPSPLTLPATRSIQAILADLSRPLPESCIATKPASKAGGTIRYLHWHTVAGVLDAYAPGWCGAVVGVERVGDKCGLTYRLTIPTTEGPISREATGMEEVTKDDYGDAMTNAEAAAFKRAAAKFGVGGWLYDRDATGPALAQHLHAERVQLLGELGAALDARQMPRAPFIAWVREQTGAGSNREIPVVALKSLVAQLAVEGA